MNHPADPRSNHLLAALPEDEWQRWLPHLERVEMPRGMVLMSSGCLPEHVYFPTTAIASRMYTTESGASCELAMIGCEGMSGVSVILGGETSLGQTVVHTGGEGFRLRRQVLVDEFNAYGAVVQLMLRYTQALITQVAQTAACNRHHSIDQQVSRWLLMRLDRLAGTDITITHEAMAQMLGVRREGVTAAARKLQVAGVIHYARGHISVLDRHGLEERTCECHGVVQREYARLLPTVVRQPGEAPPVVTRVPKPVVSVPEPAIAAWRQVEALISPKAPLPWLPLSRKPSTDVLAGVCQLWTSELGGAGLSENTAHDTSCP
jgi:CRP-like cAMP-binding protein